MIINIKNVGSIKNGSIVIQENSLNIKYGYNGIGKSTISNAIKAYIENGALSDEFKTFGSNNTLVY